MDAFDADVLIYAASAEHPHGPSVRSLFLNSEAQPVGVGSVLLLPELLAKPLRDGDHDEVDELVALLARLELLATTNQVATLATAYATQHRLRAADAVHLATAVLAGADRFVTNNSKDFARAIADIEIVYPTDLANR